MGDDPRTAGERDSDGRAEADAPARLTSSCVARLYPIGLFFRLGMDSASLVPGTDAVLEKHRFDVPALQRF